MKNSFCKIINPVFSLIFIFILTISGCAEQPEILKVSDFGAVINDGKDDTPAILKALEACKERKNAKLVFDFGTYDIYGSQKDARGNFKPSLDLKDIKNLTIEGNGAELIGHNYSTIFHFVNCQNLNISGLTIDWDPLPFTQGKVINITDEYLDLEVVAPFVAKAGLKTDAFLGYDLEKRRMARRFTDHYQKGYAKPSEVIQLGVMRLFIGSEDRFAGKMPSAGTYIIARHQVYGFQSFMFVKCSGVKMENVNIYSNPGMGVTGENSWDILLKHLKVMIRPGSGRWMSTTADATNFEGCRGTVTMENCLFEGQGDDATNVRSGEYQLVDERLGDNKLRIKTGYQFGGSPTPPEIGDQLEISGSDKLLLPYANLIVRSVQVNEKDKTYTVELADKLPDRTIKGDIIGNASSCPKLRIRNCTAIRNRARGFIIKTRDVIIEDCTFQDITASAVGLEADVKTWWESIGSRNVTIRNNRFIDCKFEGEYLKGVIESHTISTTAPAGVHSDIRIENNIFEGSDTNILKLGSAEGVVIRNNIMEGAQGDAILLYNTKNVLLEGNKLTNNKVGLKIGDGCDASTIKTVNNIGL